MFESEQPHYLVHKKGTGPFNRPQPTCVVCRAGGESILSRDRGLCFESMRGNRVVGRVQDPAPVFGALAEIRSQCIPLNIKHYLVKVIFCLDRKRLEASLIQVPFADDISMLLSACDMSHRQPLHEETQIRVSFEPHDEMPMIGHHVITADAHRTLFQGFRDGTFKLVIIDMGLKQLPSSNTPIKHMKNHSA